jgi:two-component system phosphate regulon response regulator PhoB
MNPTILVVEDEPDALELIGYHLKRAGFHVTIARDGITGLAKARDEMPALIVLDLMLPGLEGTDLCKKLRADSRTADIPVLMVTARAAEVDRILGLELGADDYVTKPFSPRELVLRVKAILHRRAPAAQEVLQCRDLQVDTAKHEVRVRGVRGVSPEV